MRNQNILFATAISLFVLSSSCKKETTPEVVNPSGTAVTFSSSINGQIKTKALNDTWETSDAIGVFMKTGTGLSNASASNKNYNTTGDGEFKPSTTDQTIFYPADGSTVDFVAYYPFKSSIPGNIYSVDVTNQSSQSAIDLLYANNATGLSKTSTTANLVFTHQLSKVEFTVKNGTGVANLNDLTVALAGLNTKANFDLATGILSGASQVVDFPAKTTAKTGSVLAEAIVVPTADASGKIVSFSLPSGKFKLTLPTGAKFEQGKKYTYEIELKNGPSNEPVAVALTAVITNWNNVPSGSYVVDQDKEVVTPPSEQVLYTETFGVGSASTRPKISSYSGWANPSFTFSDSYGATDLRTISAFPDNIHAWLPAAKDASLKIEGITVTGFTKLKLKYDLAPNASSSSSASDFNVITVKVNGVSVTVPSRPVGFADNNKFSTIELSNIPALATNTIEFFGASTANNLGMRLDNVVIIGVN